MTPSHRDWTRRFADQIEARIALYGRIGLGREGEATILACLRDVVARHRAALAADAAERDALPPAADPAPAVNAVIDPAGTAQATAWADPVFWEGGRFRPFAGTHADRMRASAAASRRLGYETAALTFERHAADQSAIVPIDEIAQAHLASITAFIAGPQIELFA